MRFENFLAIVLLVIAATQSQGVSGCGGSIKASPAIMKFGLKCMIIYRTIGNVPNFSDITVSLMTADGVIQEQIRCSPQGYFFIPMYDIVNSLCISFTFRVNTILLFPRRMAGV